MSDQFREEPGRRFALRYAQGSTAFPLIVAGMHRSGTSMVASWLAEAGVEMGEDLVPADAGNPSGYFEDVEFLQLNRKILGACTASGRAGHPDWGWTEDERFDRGRVSEFREEARSLIADRRRNGKKPWGWKDPRVSLLLDFWEEAADSEGATFLLLYRFPWDVADSMQRLGADDFLKNPGYAYRIWSYYNRHLLDFHERHRDRSVLLSTNALIRRPESLAQILASRLGVELSRTALPPTIDRERFSTLDGADPLIGLLAAASPGCIALLAELDAASDLPARELWRAPALSSRRSPVPAEAVVLSVVIPCFNQGELLLEAIASVERSEMEPVELIIVNDGSSEPRTLEILAILRAAGYRILDQENQGLSATRNNGIRASKGRYILPLDDDNRVRSWFPPEALRILNADPEIAVVYGDRQDFGKRSGLAVVPPFDLDLMFEGNYIDACAIYRREVWESVEGYDTSMTAQEDWEFWIAAAGKGWSFQKLPGPAFDYRVRPGSMVTHCDDKEFLLALRTHVFRKHRDLFVARMPGMLAAARLRDHELQQRVSALEGENAWLKGERERALSERERLTVEVGALFSERDGLRALREQLEAERDRLSQENRVLAEARARQNADLDRLAQENRVLAETLSRQNADLDRLAIERDGLLAGQDGLRGEKGRIEAERDRLSQENRVLAEALARQNADLDRLAQENRVLAETLSRQNADLDRLAIERDGLLAGQNGLRGEKGRIEAERDEFGHLEHLLRERVDYMEKTRAWRIRAQLVRWKKWLFGNS